MRSSLPPKSSPNGPEHFRPLPEVVPAKGKGLANVPAAPPEAQAIRSATAKALFRLAGRAADPSVKHFALADRCLRGVLEREPDHREARRLLGYKEYEGGWATPHAEDMLKKGMTPHPTFGWVKKTWVPHLDRGELPGEVGANGEPRRWLPAAEADALRAEWAKGWRISTSPHFEIRTNVPLAEAITFGRRLEALYDLLFSRFADVIGPANLPLARRFANPKLQPTLPTKKHIVWYFASKQEYVGFFRETFHMDEALSLGYYMPLADAREWRVQPRSYFYRDPNDPIGASATLFHEGSHQILFESAGTAKYHLNRGNFWVWEGLGTYFETGRVQPDGSLLIGGLVGPRIAEARRRIVEKDEYVPIADLVELGRDRFSAQPGVYLHYAEAMALAVFLLDGEGGRYRDAFLQYVEDAYQGRVKSPQALSDALGESYEVLDRQFLKFLKSGAVEK